MNANFLRIISILLFAGAIFFGWYGYQQSKENAKVVDIAPVIRTEAQVVANRKILAGETLALKDLSVVQVSNFNSSGFKSTRPIVGRVLKENVEKDAVIITQHFYKLSHAAQSLKVGERAVAIKVDEVAGVGGYLQPGDFVDVLLFANDDRDLKRTSIAQVVLSDLRVISFGELIEDNSDELDTSLTKKSSDSSLLLPASEQKSTNKHKPNNSFKSAVLAVKAKDATKLMIAANIGQLRLALRGEEPSLFDDSTTAVKSSDTYFIKNDTLLNRDAQQDNTAVIVKQASDIQAKLTVNKQPIVTVYHGEHVKKVVTKAAK